MFTGMREPPAALSPFCVHGMALEEFHACFESPFAMWAFGRTRRWSTTATSLGVIGSLAHIGSFLVDGWPWLSLLLGRRARATVFMCSPTRKQSESGLMSFTCRIRLA